MKEANLKRLYIYPNHMTFWKRQNYGDSERIGGCQGLGMVGMRRGGGGCDYKVGSMREIFMAVEQFCILIAVVVTRIYTCDKMT